MAPFGTEQTPPKVSWRQALTWRLRRQLLSPVGDLPAVAVVRRLGGVQAQLASAASLAVRVRQRRSSAEEIAGALTRGDLIKTWAMRGTLHLLVPEQAGDFLALLAAGRMWERPSWVRSFGLAPDEVERLRGVVRQALGGGILTREELVAEVAARTGSDRISRALRSGWGTVLKPLAFQGDLCFGPSRGNRVTFTTPEAASSAWRALPSADEAGPRAVLSYLDAYGPATVEGFRNWLSRGRVSKRQLREWFGAVSERVAEVEVDGTRAYVRAEHIDALAGTRPPRSPAVRLVGGFDGWVLGPGTEDTHVLPAARRPAVSRQSGWIAPAVLVDGVVRGTWELTRVAVRISWFAEAGTPPRAALQAEGRRLAGILDRDLPVETVLT